MKKVYELIANYLDGESEYFGQYDKEKDAFQRAEKLIKIKDIVDFEIKIKVVK